MSSHRHRLTHWTTYREAYLRRGRAGRPFRRWRDQVLKDPVPICCRCGRPIDKSLPWRHPMSATADHFPVPLSRLLAHQVLDPANGRPAHRRCNLSAGNRAPSGTAVPAVADRRW